MRSLDGFLLCGVAVVFAVGSVAACGDSGETGVGGSTSSTSAATTTGASTSNTGGAGGVGPTAVDPAVVSGADATYVCALRTGGVVVCWGANERGQLGQG